MKVEDVKKFFLELPNKIIFKCLTDSFVEDYDNAFNIVSKSLDKQISKTPIEVGQSIDRVWLCPFCKEKVGDCEAIDNYCKHCGQRLKHIELE